MVQIMKGFRLNDFGVRGPDASVVIAEIWLMRGQMIEVFCAYI